jgi:hypothetical protein
MCRLSQLNYKVAADNAAEPAEKRSLSKGVQRCDRRLCRLGRAPERKGCLRRDDPGKPSEPIGERRNGTTPLAGPKAASSRVTSFTARLAFSGSRFLSQSLRVTIRLLAPKTDGGASEALDIVHQLV